MAKEHISGSKEGEEKRRARKPPAAQPASPRKGSGLAEIQQKIGNRALQRLIAQRSSNAPSEVDDETASRIQRERGGGQPLDRSVQEKTEPALGADFSGVRVHTSPEAHTLNQQLNARAFTTGQDIFFREGEYQPSSSSGQALIAHELTHVAQQSSGAVSGGGGKMTVNAPGDPFEQQADAAARQITQSGGAASVQREIPQEEEELQTKSLQRESLPEEVDPLAQRQEMEDEEEGNA